MKLEQSFTVTAPVEQVWAALIDVERVAPCLPGAEITGQSPDGGYEGTFAVKLGPATASYRGSLRMESLDEANRVATMTAKGTDKRGQGGASASIVSSMRQQGDETVVEVVTEFTITGRLARFGRGGMIEDISKRLMRDFAQCLESTLGSEPAPAASGDAMSAADAAVAEALAALESPSPEPEPAAPEDPPEPTVDPYASLWGTEGGPEPVETTPSTPAPPAPAAHESPTEAGPETAGTSSDFIPPSPPAPAAHESPTEAEWGEGESASASGSGAPTEPAPPSESYPEPAAPSEGDAAPGDFGTRPSASSEGDAAPGDSGAGESGAPTEPAPPSESYPEPAAPSEGDAAPGESAPLPGEEGAPGEGEPASPAAPLPGEEPAGADAQAADAPDRGIHEVDPWGAIAPASAEAAQGDEEEAETAARTESIPPPSATPRPAAQPAKPVKGFSLLLSVFFERIKRSFRRKK